MGLASGGGGGGFHGGGFYYFGGHGDGDAPLGLVIGVGVVVLGLVGGLAAGAIIHTNQIAQERAALEEQLAIDARVRDFNLDYFDWVNDVENNKYLFVFTGNAIKIDGQPMDFIATKYEVSEKNYYEIITYIEENKIEGLDHKSGLLSKVLDVIKESELIYNNTIDTAPNAITNADDGETLAIKSIELPVIDEEKGIIYYKVETMGYNSLDGDDPTIELDDKVVVTKLTDELRENPNLVYLVDKKKCKVITSNKNVISLQKQNLLRIDKSNRTR